MKSKLIMIITMLIFGVGFVAPAHAAFDSGSTGADGPFSPTANTVLQIPESGIFNFTTVNIPAGVTVTFTKNSKNTPVTILTTGDVAIAGTINLNAGNGSYIIPGVGGPGGFDGGQAGVVSQAGKRGEGPGGGTGGSPKTNGTYAGGCGGGGGFSGGGGGGGTYYSDAPGGAGGTAYSNDRILPLIGGSGGAGGGGTNTYVGGAGGGGGGAIVIASSGMITVSGSITANGGSGANGDAQINWCNTGDYSGGGGGAGAGGSIRLIANTIAGNGTINATGGGGGRMGCNQYGGGGSLGRIRLEASSYTRTAATNPPFTMGVPSAVVPSNMPTLIISSIGGVEAPTVPKGSIGAPDVTLPYNSQNPITVVITGANIPAGTTVTLKATPSVITGTASTATGVLSGTDASSSTSISINISKAYPSLLTSSVTFQLSASNGGPIYAEGELVEKVRVEASIGGESSITYITASGKEIPASKLKS